MPTSTEVYKLFLLKINRNDTNSDIDINRGEFVLLYNEQKDVWLKQQINAKESNISSQDLNEVQVKHLSLTKLTDATDYSVFALPENFFSYISSYTTASQGVCGGKIIRNYPIKPMNENMLLENSNYEPSFEFEETIVDLSNNKLFVYKKDFEIEEVFFNYYREVGKIDLAGYRKLDGDMSTNIDPDISSIYINEILNRCAEEVIRRYENPEGFQLAQDRINKEE